MKAVLSDRAAAESTEAPEVAVVRFEVRGGRVVQMEIFNAAYERADGVYVLYLPIAWGPKETQRSCRALVQIERKLNEPHQ